MWFLTGVLEIPAACILAEHDGASREADNVDGNLKLESIQVVLLSPGEICNKIYLLGA